MAVYTVTRRAGAAQWPDGRFLSAASRTNPLCYRGRAYYAGRLVAESAVMDVTLPASGGWRPAGGAVVSSRG
jgi:hypothetical protein